MLGSFTGYNLLDVHISDRTPLLNLSITTNTPKMFFLNPLRKLSVSRHADPIPDSSSPSPSPLYPASTSAVVAGGGVGEVQEQPDEEGEDEDEDEIVCGAIVEEVLENQRYNPLKFAWREVNVLESIKLFQPVLSFRYLCFALLSLQY